MELSKRKRRRKRETPQITIDVPHPEEKVRKMIGDELVDHLRQYTIPSNLDRLCAEIDRVIGLAEKRSFF